MRKLNRGSVERQREIQTYLDMPDSFFYSMYDHDKLIKYKEKADRKGTLDKYFTGGVVREGVENLMTLDGEQFVGFGNHKSHFDYLLFADDVIEAFSHGNFPHIVAGKSLDFKILGLRVLPMLVGFNYKWANLFWHNRMGSNAYKLAWDNKFLFGIDEGRSYMVYPQGTRDFDSERSGHKFRNNKMLDSIIESDMNPYILSVTVDYDNIIEATQKEGILSARKKMKQAPEGLLKHIPIIRSVPQNIAKLEYYIARDGLAFFQRRFLSKDTGQAFIKYGEPKRVNDILELSEIEDDFTPDSNEEKAQVLANYINKSIESDFQSLRTRLAA